MSATIINRGKIIIDIEAGAINIPVPKFDEVLPKQAEMTRATDAQARATESAKRAEEEAEKARIRAIEAGVRNHREANERLQQMSEGFLKLSRSAVLLGFSQSESLQDLLKNLALVQAGFDALDGSRKVITSLSETMAKSAKTGQTLFQVIGSGNIAMAAGAAAVTLLAAAWASARREEEAYQAQLRQANSAKASLRDASMSELLPSERIAILERDRTKLPGIVGTPDEVEKNAEAYRRVEEQLLAAHRAELQLADQAKGKQIEAIRGEQQRLELAQQRLRTEQNAVRAYEAAYSQLNKFEQGQVKAAFDKLRKGGSLSEYERRLVERTGQSGIVEFDRAREGRAEGANAEQDLRGLQGATVGVSGSMQDFAKEVQRATEALTKLTSDREASTAIAELEQQRQEIERASVDLGKAFLKALKYVESQINIETKRNGQMRESLIRDRNTANQLFQGFQ